MGEPFLKNRPVCWLQAGGCLQYADGKVASQVAGDASAGSIQVEPGFPRGLPLGIPLPEVFHRTDPKGGASWAHLF